MKTRLNRRSFLRGAGGTALALPLLEVMMPRRAWAQAAPKRLVVCFAGMSLGRDNIGDLKDIVPSGSGPGFTFRPPMQPLEAIRDDVAVVSGLRIPIGGPGGRLDGFHKSSISPLLCGAEPESAGPDCNGVTADQVVAQDPAFQGKTRFDFLSYRVQAQAYRGGGNVGVISWSDRRRKNDPTVSPSLAFKDLFTGFTPPQPGAVPNTPAPVPDLAQRETASVLDLVAENAGRLQQRLGRADQMRLERHFDEIRALEERLSTIPGDAPPVKPTSGCSTLADPGADPGVNTTQAAGETVGYAGEETRAQVMTELMVKAFACDQTRVATLQYTCVQCFMNVEELVGVRMDLHELAHLSSIQGGQDVAQQKVMEMYGWHMKHFAALASALKAEIGPDGRPLLDNTVLVFVNEGGLGPGEGKPIASHSTENMMAVVAGGRALGLKTGQHLVSAGGHPAQVLTAAINAVGVNAAGLGEVTGRLPGL